MVKVILYRTKGFIPALIKWQSRGPYCHASIVAGGFVYESHLETGVVRRAISDEDMLSDWFKVEADPQQEFDMCKFLNDQVGKKYDLTMIARFLTRRQEHRAQQGKWFCSELVVAALNAGGIWPFARTQPWEVSPNMLAKSPLLTK